MRRSRRGGSSANYVDDSDDEGSPTVGSKNKKESSDEELVESDSQSEEEEVEEVEDDSEEDVPVKNVRNSRKVVSDDDDMSVEEIAAPSRTEKNRNSKKPKVSTYADVPSDDDFGVSESHEDDSEIRSAVEEQLRMEKMVDMKTLTRGEWIEYCKGMNTSKVTKGRREAIVKAEAEYDLANGIKRRKKLTQKKLKKPENRYLVKWAKDSYLHVSWETKRALKAYFKDARTVDRHIQKMNMAPALMDAETLADMCQIDRIVDEDTFFEENSSPASKPEATSYAVKTVIDDDDDEEEEDDDEEEEEEEEEEEIKPTSRGEQKEYLVKWKSQGFEDTTWELFEDIQHAKSIDAHLEFFRLRNSEEWRISRAQLGTDDPSYKSSMEFKNARKLRSYQVEAVDWLCFNFKMGRNSILADEMGLGKTCQTVCYMHRLRNACNVSGPFLVVAPLATLPHWQREFEAWSDFNCITYHGSSEGRDLIRNREFFWDKVKKGPPKFDVIVTNYETVLRDVSHLKGFKWSLLAVDEAHRLKNRDSSLTACLRENFTFGSKLLLTGTPIQNSLPELWTLLNFINPRDFPSLEKFDSNFGAMTTAEEMDKFHDRLRPFMLRRIKSEVEPLPDRDDTLIEVELTTMQKRFYRAIYEKNTEYLLAGVEKGARISLNNVAMELRKCCCHPYLIDGVESKILADDPPPPTSSPEHDLHIFSKLVQASGKMLLLDKLLPKLKQEGHRVLIFSQMTRMLDILEDYLLYRQYSFERIDGSVRGVDRQFAIDRFSNTTSQSFCFLLSTRGCGQGINLTAADTVIMYDGDWNPQNDVQALARCHRIGQTKKVMVYRLITRKTYEFTMFQRASMKLGLDHAVMTGLTDVAGGEDGKKMSKKEQDKETERLLKYGAYALADDDDTEAKQFEEANIDEILQSRATHIKSSNEDNRLSKATFVVSGSDTNLDIEDPDFWTKVVGLKEGIEIDEVLSDRKARRSKNISYAESGFAKINRENNSEFEDEEEDEEEDGSKRDEDVNGRKLWLRKHFQHLMFGLDKYGYGQWSKTHATVAAKFPGRYTEAQVAEAVRGFLIFCLFRKKKGGDASDGEGSSDNSDEATEDNPKDDVTDFKLVNMKSEEVIERMELLLESEGYGDVYSMVVEDLKVGQDFLVPDCLTTRQKLLDPSASVEDSDSDDSEEEDQEKRELKKREKRGFAYDDKISERTRTNAVKHIRMMDKHMHLSDFVDKHSKEDGTPDFDSFPDVPGSLPAPWWQKRDDMMLLFGLHKYGWDPRRSTDTFEAIRHDAALPFSQNPSESDVQSSRKKKDEEKDEEKKDDNDSLLWPKNHRLGLRAKRLVDFFRVNGRKAKRQENMDSKKRERAERKVTIVDEWTKSERREVYKYLSRYGVPSSQGVCLNPDHDLSYERFLLVSKLRKKSPEMLESFVKSFVQDAIQIRMDAGHSSTLKNSDILISQASSKKLLERISLLREIRTKLLTKKPEELLSCIKSHRSKLGSKKKTAMSSWWTAESDLALVQGSAVHGIGSFQAAEDLRTDPAFPFAATCKSNNVEMNSKPKKDDEDESPADNVVAEAEDDDKCVFPSVVMIMARLKGVSDTIARHQRSSFSSGGLFQTVSKDTEPKFKETESDLAENSLKEEVVVVLEDDDEMQAEESTPAVKTDEESPKRKVDESAIQDATKRSCYGIKRFFIPK